MSHQEQKRGLMYNWLSLLGVTLAATGLVAGSAMMAIDYFNRAATPYSGLFTYIGAPFVIALGLVMFIAGLFAERRRRHRIGIPGVKPMPVIDLNDRRHYMMFVVVVVATFVVIVASGIGSYHAYAFTESVKFCGETCHAPMKPERTTYKNSPHANVRCVDCHIGPGAGSFVAAKLRGLHQLRAVLINKYQHPIPTPISNLRPASETCYECHWPAKFFGTVEQTKTYYGLDVSNTPYTVSLLLSVGGGDLTHGLARGIHWHMNVSRKIEYIAKDAKREIIPWVRVTDSNGNVSVYATTDKSEALTPAEISAATPRVMDCIDCHNRPAHQYQSPDRALNLALLQGSIDPSIPSIKRHAAEALLGTYTNEVEALAAIDAKLRKDYPEPDAKVEAAISEVKGIYSRNFFPEMKVQWDAYPDNIGHFIAPGCFRCHDNKHVDEKGDRVTTDCKQCHVITAQGPGVKLATYVREGVDFKHPGSDEGDDSWKDDRCDTCHSGAPDI